MEIFLKNQEGLTDLEIKEAIIKSIEGKELKKVLIIRLNSLAQKLKLELCF